MSVNLRYSKALLETKQSMQLKSKKIKSVNFFSPHYSRGGL